MNRRSWATALAMIALAATSWLAATPDAAHVQSLTPTPTPLPNRAFLPLVSRSWPPTLTWQTRAPLLATRSYLGAAATSSGKVYAIGGRHYEGLLGPVEEYDPGTDTWIARAALPTQRYALATATGKNGRIYAAGGVAGFPDPTVVATVEEYDPSTDSWAAKADMPTARHGLGLAAAPNGRLYAIGGTLVPDGGGPIAIVEEYDPDTNTWTARASTPTARAYVGVAVAGNGKIYAIGGADYSTSSATFFASVEEFDPVSNTWISRASMPTARAELAVVAAPNGKLYAVGGNSVINDWLSTVEEFDPAANTWRTVEPIGVARRGLAGALASNGRLYLIGGRYFAPRGDLSVVEEATIRAAP